MSISSSATSDCKLLPSVVSTGNRPKSHNLSYAIANDSEDLSAAFSLIYNSYRRTGLMGENLSGMRLTPFHLLPTTEVFFTKHEETVVSTVSLIGDGELGLPLESIYPVNVAIARRHNLRMAEIGCLADRRKSHIRFIETFATMGKLLAQVAMARGYDGLVAAAHPKHARLYQRILPFEQIGTETKCSYANGNPAVMLAVVFDDHKGSEIFERFFGSLAGSVNTSPRPWSADTLSYFKRILRENQLQSESSDSSEPE